MELGFSRIEGLSTPAWKITGLIDNSLRRQLLNVLTADVKREFSVATCGQKLSLEHNSPAGSKLFQQVPCQILADMVISSALLRLMSSLIKTTDSKFNDLFPSSSSILKPIRRLPRESSKKHIDRVGQAWKPSLSALYDRIDPSFHAELFAKARNCLPFIPRMQFSIMRKGTYIPPHTDIGNKIATLMIYLPTSERQSDSKLGTTFWNPITKNSNVLSQRVSRFLTGSDLTFFKENYEPVRTKFDGNACTLFFRRDSSWHSFEHDDFCEDDRHSINISFLYPIDKSA